MTSSQEVNAEFRKSFNSETTTTNHVDDDHVYAIPVEDSDIDAPFLIPSDFGGWNGKKLNTLQEIIARGRLFDYWDGKRMGKRAMNVQYWYPELEESDKRSPKSGYKAWAGKRSVKSAANQGFRAFGGKRGEVSGMLVLNHHLAGKQADDAKKRRTGFANWAGKRGHFNNWAAKGISRPSRRGPARGLLSKIGAENEISTRMTLITIFIQLILNHI